MDNPWAEETPSQWTEDPPWTRTSPSPPASPDFGTFEEASEADEDDEQPVWTPTATAFPDSADSTSWGAAWNADKLDTQHSNTPDEPPDEWAAAKLQQEQVDRVVPRELLASVLLQIDQLSKDIYAGTPALDSGLPLTVLEDTNEFASVLDRIIPSGLTLPTILPFSKSFILKSMTETVRLTRNTGIAHASPFANYLAAKGSTAWEASIKSRPEFHEDDILPPGWRIMEKNVPSSSSDLKKKTGGLLSFLGKRSATTVKVSNASLQGFNKDVVASPRSSQERPEPNKSEITKTTIEPVSSSNPVELTAPSSVPSQQTPDTPDGDAAPSVVSRFMNRFSRTKSNGSSSLSLSSDDLEFLSDLAPQPLKPMKQSDLSLPEALGATPLSASALAQPISSLAASAASAHPSISTPVTLDDLSFFDDPFAQPSNATIPPLSNMVRIPSPLSTSSLDIPWNPISGNAPSLSRQRQSPTRTNSLPPKMNAKKVPPVVMSAIPSTFSAPAKPLNFQLPPPPSLADSVRRNTSSNQASHLSLPSKSTNGKKVLTQELFEDEEFSDFHSAPNSHDLPRLPASTSSQKSYDDSFSSVSSGLGLFGGQIATSQSDDFDDFISPSLRTPSPPPLPSKTSQRAPKQMIVPQLPPTSETTIQSRRKASRAADHQRTLSLVEIAASKPGKWPPAPPSPLPQLLPPPEAPPKIPSHANLLDVDVTSVHSTFSSIRNETTPSPQSRPMTPASGPFQQGRQPAASILHQESIIPLQFTSLNMEYQAPTSLWGNSTSPTTHAKGPAPSMKPGGLSAQDLSFFEGI